MIVDQVNKVVWNRVHKPTHTRLAGKTEELILSHDLDHIAYILRRFPKGFRSVLDLGIWHGWLGALIKSIYHVRVDGVEGYAPYIAAALPFYDHLTLGDIPEVLRRMCQQNIHYDVVVCLGTIEHFDDPVSALEDMEQIATNGVFITSPNFFFASQSWNGNKLQMHRSFLPARIMRDRGYELRGAGVLADKFGLIGRLFPYLDSGYFAWKLF